MISSLRSLLAPGHRRPRRSSHFIPDALLAFEDRVMPSVSISTTIDGLRPPVLSLTLSQPSAAGSQVASLTLSPSPADLKLFQDAASGKPLKSAEIVLSDKGNRGFDRIILKDASISSFRTITTPNGKVTEVISLVGRGFSSASISTTIDGLRPPVLSLTLSQPSAAGSQVASLTLSPSPADSKLFQDAESGKALEKIQIVLQRYGTKATYTITLTNVLISSIKTVTAPNGKVTEVVSFAARDVTID